MLAVGRYFVLVGLFKRGSGGFLKSRGSGVLCKNSAWAAKALRMREQHNCAMRDLLRKTSRRSHSVKLSATRASQSIYLKMQNRRYFAQYNPESDRGYIKWLILL